MNKFVPLILVGSLGLTLCFVLTEQSRVVPETNQVLAQVPKIIQPQIQPPQPVIKEKVIRLPSPVKGVLNKMLVQEGQSVKTGELLAQLDDRLPKNEVQAAKAKVLMAQEEYKSAVALAREAKAQLDRLIKLPPTAVTKEEVFIKKLIAERYEYEEKARLQSLELARLEQTKAEILLSMYQIESPVNGIVRKVFKQTSEAVGELETVLEIAISHAVPKVKKILKIPSQVKGIITRVLVKEGQAAKQGDLLAQMDDQLAMNDVKMAHAELSMAQAEYKSTEATAKEAEKQLERLKLLPKVAVSQEEIGVKKLTFERYKYETEGRKQAILIAELNLNKGEIRASWYRIQMPVDGTIVKIHKQAGEAVGEFETIIEIAMSGKE